MENVGTSCPIDSAQLNENVVRLIAAQVILVIAASVLTGFYWLTAFVLIDFTLRGFFGGQGSILKSTAKLMADSLNLKPKITNAAPKKFAAKIGFFVVCGLLAAQITDQLILIGILSGAIVLFAILESVFAVCVGCILYQQLNRFR